MVVFESGRIMLGVVGDEDLGDPVEEEELHELLPAEGEYDVT